LLFVIGCPDGRHEVLLDLRTDLRPGQEFASVRTYVEGDEGTGAFIDHDVVAGADYVAGVRIAELALPTGNVRVRVEALANDGAVVAARPVSIEVDGPLGVTVVLARECVDVTCPLPDGDPTATACAGGNCVDAACTVENPAACGDAECNTAGDCDPPPAACASAECAGTVCLSRPDDSVCSEGEYCDVALGCRSPDAPVFLRYEEATHADDPTITAAAGELFGDMRLTPTSATSFDIVFRFVSTMDFIPDTRPVTSRGPLVEEADGRWLFSPEGAATVVYSEIERTTDQWIFVVDETDPRSSPIYARRAVFRLAPLPSDDVTGSWTLAAWRDGDVGGGAGECTTDSDGDFVTIDLSVELEPDGTVLLDESSFLYDAAGCMSITSELSLDAIGYVTADGAGSALFHLWDVDAARGVLLDADYAFSGENLVLTPSDCRPSANCRDIVTLELAPR